MELDGFNKYGADSYGPGGTIIDTDFPFEVKTEFLSTTDKSKVWGLKSTLSQSGDSMEFWADCRGYIELLTTPLNEDMSFTLSTWSNLDGREPSFPRSSNCPAVSPSCEGAKVSFTDVVFNQDGSAFDPEPITTEFLDLTVSESGSLSTKYVKGLEDRILTTDG